MGILFPLASTRSSRPAAGATVRFGVSVALLAAGLLASSDLIAQTATVAITNGKDGSVIPLAASAPLRPISWSSRALAQYMVFDSLFNGFSFYTGGAEPYRYEPASNSLVVIKRGYTGESDNIYVRRSNDMGATWTAPKGPLHNSSQGNGRYPCITILNKTNSSNPADLLYHFTFPVVINDEFGTTFQGFLDGAMELLSPAEANTGAKGPDDGDYNWSTDAKTVFSSNGNVAITASDMSGNNLGIRRYDLSTGTLTAAIPASLASANFSDPGSPDSRTSLVVGIGRDGGSNEKVYLGIMSRFPTSDAEGGTRPYPAVSVSNDGGVTWGDLQVLPVATVRQYAEANGANPDSTLFPYNQSQDFMVTGEDEYSFLMNLFEVNADKADNETLRQLVEVYRSGGNWGIRKVSDISGIIFTFDPISPETERRNQKANEAHFFRSADGNAYGAYWVELFDRVFDRDINGDNESPDTLRTSDVLVSIRKKSTGAWSSEPLNVTNSDIVDRLVWLPPVVGDLTKLPLLTVQSKPDGNETNDQERWVTSQLNVEREQLVTISNVDVSQLAGVGSSVSATGLRLSATYPNPATTSASFGFTLPSAGRVQIALWDASGKRLATVLDERREAGAHSASVDASALANGVYYCTLTFNGETITNTVTVVR